MLKRAVSSSLIRFLNDASSPASFAPRLSPGAQSVSSLSAAAAVEIRLSGAERRGPDEFPPAVVLLPCRSVQKINLSIAPLCETHGQAVTRDRRSILFPSPRGSRHCSETLSSFHFKSETRVALPGRVIRGRFLTAEYKVGSLNLALHAGKVLRCFSVKLRGFSECPRPCFFSLC